MNSGSKTLLTTIGVISGVVTLMALAGSKGNDGAGGAFAVGILFFLGMLAYNLPLFVAMSREHNNTVGIGVLNFFLGWTVLGWVGALVWASTNNTAAQVVQSMRVPPPAAEEEPSDVVLAVRNRLAKDERRCPMCAEKIKVAAIKCKHCGSLVNQVATSE